MIPWTSLTKEKIYTHVHADGSQCTHFAVDRMLKDIKIKLIPPVLVNVDFKYAVHIMENHGIERHRLERLITNISDEPILLARYPDNTDVMLDGNHRYLSAAARKQSEILAVRVPQSLWQQFVITGCPYSREQIKHFVKHGFSGIMQ